MTEIKNTIAMNMLRALTDKGDNMREQMGNVTEMEILRTKKKW